MKNSQFLRILPFVLGLSLAPEIRAQDLGGSVSVPTGEGAVQTNPPGGGPIKRVPRAEVKKNRAARHMSVGQTCTEGTDSKLAKDGSICPAPYTTGTQTPINPNKPQNTAAPLTQNPENISGR